MGPLNDSSPNMVDTIEYGENSSRRGTPSIPVECGYESRLTSAVSQFGIEDEETLEGRFSRSLQSWMPDYEYSSLQPIEKPPYEPVYSGKLSGQFGKKRSTSEESLVTLLSLFSCSTEEPETVTVVRKKKKKRKKTNDKSVKEQPKYTWAEIEAMNKKTSGEFMSYMKTQNALAMDAMYGFYEPESIAFQMMDDSEKKGIIHAGRSFGIRLVSNLHKSNSTTNIKRDLAKSSLKRSDSVGNIPKSKPLNIQEIKRKRFNKSLLLLQKQQQQQQAKLGKSRRRSLAQPRHSESSDVSSGLEINSPSIRSESPEVDEKILLWKGDREILEMDLKKGLTTRAMRKIKSTTAALERVTGFGETNQHQKTVGRHEEFPYYIDEDYGAFPKIVQRLRISPQLSNVIKSDIKVRMGRPRYHEIRQKDLDVWNHGQTLDRAHRNLKVFNWLHSLREDDFVKNIEPKIDDSPPSADEQVNMWHVESVDEPDVKPLYLKDFWN